MERLTRRCRDDMPLSVSKPAIWGRATGGPTPERNEPGHKGEQALIGIILAEEAAPEAAGSIKAAKTAEKVAACFRDRLDIFRRKARPIAGIRTQRLRRALGQLTGQTVLPE